MINKYVGPARYIPDLMLLPIIVLGVIPVTGSMRWINLTLAFGATIVLAHSVLEYARNLSLIRSHKGIVQRLKTLSAKTLYADDQTGKVAQITFDRVTIFRYFTVELYYKNELMNIDVTTEQGSKLFCQKLTLASYSAQIDQFFNTYHVEELEESAYLLKPQPRQLSFHQELRARKAGQGALDADEAAEFLALLRRLEPCNLGS